MQNKGTDPNVYTRVLIYNNSVIKESFDFTWIWVLFIVLFNPVSMIRSDPFVLTITKGHSPARESDFARTS